MSVIAALYHWTVIPDTTIDGYNLYSEDPLTVEQCLRMCEASPACLSVDYWKDGERCYLGSRTPMTHQLEDNTLYDLYVPCVIRRSHGMYSQKTNPYSKKYIIQVPNFST